MDADGRAKRHALAEMTPLGRTFRPELDDAWIGIAKRIGAPALAVYDYARLVELLELGGAEDPEGDAADLADTYGINSPLVLYGFSTPDLDDDLEDGADLEDDDEPVTD